MGKLIDKSYTCKLYQCVPEHWCWLPKSMRIALGWCHLMGFSLSFFSPALIAILFIPAFWKRFPYQAGVTAVSLMISYLIPIREWTWYRKLGQLWYEIFDFSSNVGIDDAIEILDYAENHKLILAMHPHGIVPFQGVLWSAFCDQYLRDNDRQFYGFGAAADAVFWVPFLRNITGFIAGESAAYSVLKKGIEEGKVSSAPSRCIRNLFIFPGGIAEVFTSKPKQHTIVFNNRRGLCKLSIETNSELIPCYVFGGTDFFENLITNKQFNWLMKLCRHIRVGFTIFWGRCGLPIPYTPKVTMVIGDPIPIPVVPDDDERKSKAIDQLHATYMKEIHALFEKYKVVAGYPDAQLEIL